MTTRRSTPELLAMLDAPRAWVLNAGEHGTLRYALLMAASYRGEGIPGGRVVSADGAVAIDEEQVIEMLRLTGLGTKPP